MATRRRLNLIVSLPTLRGVVLVAIYTASVVTQHSSAFQVASPATMTTWVLMISLGITICILGLVRDVYVWWLGRQSR